MSYEVRAVAAHALSAASSGRHPRSGERGGRRHVRESARGAQAVIAAIASSMVGPSNQSWLSLTLPSCAISHAEFGAGP